ncbi:5-methyltetrahydropteroyltriglutamate--homocysteine S-methyltransferase [Flammeovirga sp. MY04]|uniref:5-methyltetrahydropteroyltriglutamate-- homocysteine S-methyltransferase n=1 Tax=Flammeovirga sp. MY04 TaxID=1191459 RepID=UPI00080639C6|nr:5-methyltetrahydropteroyltriglutamate--homocysteine S-methyltransferase [Flammeovirga sp. MY04]ANQ49587.1 5-methyltetrahydropteroyltriglutamate--homocysteine S-methyltransferase [Flammeovirga sp. MY04]
MKTRNFGFPRIGAKRELKKALEQFWAKEIDAAQLIEVGKDIRKKNWEAQSILDDIPSNDFSFYDQILDLIYTFDCLPKRFRQLQQKENLNDLELYFALARGFQNETSDVKAMEMTKWFDTNYHFIVPEFYKNTQFSISKPIKIVEEYNEAKVSGFETLPTIIGPVTFLWLGKEIDKGFHRLDLLDDLLASYSVILDQLLEHGASKIQFDEPCLALDENPLIQECIKKVYQRFGKEFPQLDITLGNYFDCYGGNLTTVLQLPIHTLHLDLVRCGEQINDILNHELFNENLHLSLGIIDGRNVWKNDFRKSLEVIKKVEASIGSDRIVLSPSCSLLHSPIDLNLEDEQSKIYPEVKPWLSFAQQKIEELEQLKALVAEKEPYQHPLYVSNQIDIQSRITSELVNNLKVQERVKNLSAKESQRASDFKSRKVQQAVALQLPLLPTTSIGSLPQTKEVRKNRSLFKRGKITHEQYSDFIKNEIKDAIRFQESIDVDVLVHGEFERNDMVEFFGEQLDGFTFTSHGWVQSFGSRYVKPPIIYGDVHRSEAMTVKESAYAQSLTERPVKGMLTGPVTILQWSFVRDDQPRHKTCKQISLAIRDEVIDLEKAGLKVIQIDEPAFREGLPLRKGDWQSYLDWAVDSFKISSSGVKDGTQIHTHMCYSKFNDIIKSIAAMDADVITIECSRSQLHLLNAFSNFKYPNEIGPGIYDIHSPNVPSIYDMLDFINKAKIKIPLEQLWVNPDCGLKTRGWTETKASLEAMVNATKKARELFTEKVS